MKRTITLFLFLIHVLTAFGQKISVDTFFISKVENSSNSQNERLKFPIIRTGNLQVDEILNNDLVQRFTNNELPNRSIDSVLIRWSEGIVYLDFDVTYLKNGIISFNLNAEGCGAYCNTWTEYFTYDCRIGQLLTFDQIINMSGNFLNRVIYDKNSLYEKQKKELKEMLLDKSSELNEDTYNWALEQYQVCQKEFKLNSFALHDDHIEIIEGCYLPNAIKNLNVLVHLKYDYTDVQSDLKIKL